MFDQYLSQLASPDPVQRRAAIIGLGRLGDKQALPGLAKIYRTDPDPALRELAFKAGQAIQARQSTVSTPPPPPETPLPPPPSPITAPSAMIPAPSAEITSFVPRQPTDAERKRAREMLRNAFAYKTNGDDHNAMASLARALHLDPDLRTDHQTRNIASALVGGSGPDSIDMVLQKAELSEMKFEAKAFDSEIIDLVLSLVLLFAVIVVFCAALVYGLTALINQFITITPMSGADQADLYTAVRALSLQQALPDILRVSAITMASAFFQIMITYLVGNSLGGTGNFLRFGRVMLNLNTAQYVGYAVGFGAVVIAILSNGANIVTFGQFGAIVLGLTFLGGFVATIYYAGRIMEVNIGKAIAMVFLGSLASSILANMLGIFNMN